MCTSTSLYGIAAQTSPLVCPPPSPRRPTLERESNTRRLVHHLGVEVVKENSDILMRRDRCGERRPPAPERKDSVILDKLQMCDSVSWDHLELGDLLGKGSFNQANEVTVLCKPSRRSPIDITLPYAIKHVRDSFKNNQPKREIALKDLAIEAKLLEHLKHENIIELHAVGDLKGFLLLDRLYGTLEDRIIKWRREDSVPKPAGLLSLKIDPCKKAREDRLRTVALPVTKAMQYLHSRKIIFRDLKPANIGYAGDDTVKLFDFGLARQIVDNNRRMTGFTGTLRYMPPEIYESEHYGLSADVYSFGLFLWELSVLRKPYHGMGPAEIADEVMVRGHRPKLGRKCGSFAMQGLMRRCWSVKPDKRPTFSKVRAALEEELHRTEGRDQENTEYQRASFTFGLPRK